MQNYNSVHGRLPPAVVYGDHEKPLYSWRVLLLPFIEEQYLYQQFRLDEPWDSPHNLELLPKMPRNYSPPSGKASKVPPYHTVIHVFVGKGAAFEGKEGLHFPQDFPNGPSNTLLVVEAGPPVPWTKPEELSFDPDGPLPELQGLFKDGFRATLADGSRRFIRRDTSEATLREAITRNSGKGAERDE
jgi:hypothetical protein